MIVGCWGVIVFIVLDIRDVKFLFIYLVYRFVKVKLILVFFFLEFCIVYVLKY